MAWDEWEQLKAEALRQRQDSAHMRLNGTDAGGAGGGGGAHGSSGAPGTYGVLKASQKDLAALGRSAHTLYNDLWDRARVAVPTSDSAATDLTQQGFALGKAGYSGYTLFTAIQVYARGVDDSVAVERLIGDYTSGVEASATCR
jgi:hypothetical protein